MATNEIFRDADSLSLPVPTGTLAGAPLRIGILNAVAITNEGSVVNADNKVYGISQPTGGIGNKPGFASVQTSGAFRVPVSGARAVGDPVYITGAGALTGTATGNFLWGTALRAKGTGVGDLIVRLVQPGQTAASA